MSKTPTGSTTSTFLIDFCRFPHSAIDGMNKLTRTLFVGATLVALATIFLIPKSTLAQNEPGVAYFGVQGGLSQATFGGESVSASSRKGATLGADVSYNLNDVLSVELDFLYSELGADGVTVQGGPNVSDAYDYQDDAVRVDYFQFPVLLKVTAPIEVVKVRAVFGPSLSFLSGAEENGSSTQTDLQSEQPVTNRFLLHDFGGVVGGEIALPVPVLGGSEVALTGRYNLGLKDVDQTQGFTIKNRAYSGSLVFRVPF